MEFVLFGRGRGENTGAVQVLSSFLWVHKRKEEVNLAFNSSFLDPHFKKKKITPAVFWRHTSWYLGMQDWQHYVVKYAGAKPRFCLWKTVFEARGAAFSCLSPLNSFAEQVRAHYHGTSHASSAHGRKEALIFSWSPSHFTCFFWQDCHNSPMKQSHIGLISVPTEIPEDLITTDYSIVRGILLIGKSK